MHSTEELERWPALRKEDAELSAELRALLQHNVAGDPYSSDGSFARSLTNLSPGLKAMAATHWLDISLTLDSICWHFGNFGEPALVALTESGLRELGLNDLASCFRDAAELMLPLLEKCKQETADPHEILEANGLAEAGSALDERAWALDNLGGARSIIYESWIRYTRRHPERVFQTELQFAAVLPIIENGLAAGPRFYPKAHPDEQSRGPALAQLPPHSKRAATLTAMRAPIETLTMPVNDPTNAQTLLLIAASRGLGLAMAAEFLRKGWRIVATTREGSDLTHLQQLAAANPGRLEMETLDICDQSQVSALSDRLANRRFDMLFINAGITNHNPSETIGEVSTDEFVRVMVTNALCPMRVVESLQHLVTDAGLIGIMSSGQGSIANNTRGMREVYRGSKAALNQSMRSFAARDSTPKRPMVLMAPGWVRTELGGPDAPLTIEDSVPNLVQVLLNKQGSPGLEYLDYLGRTVPW